MTLPNGAKLGPYEIGARALLSLSPHRGERVWVRGEVADEVLS